jgi:hypothetical protein
VVDAMGGGEGDEDGVGAGRKMEKKTHKKGENVGLMGRASRRFRVRVRRRVRARAHLLRRRRRCKWRLGGRSAPALSPVILSTSLPPSLSRSS